VRICPPVGGKGKTKDGARQTFRPFSFADDAQNVPPTPGHTHSPPL